MSRGSVGGVASGAPDAGRSRAFAAEFASRHALALLVGLGAALRFATLGAQDFWLDEQVTLDLIAKDPVEIFRGVVNGESNPVLYYALAGGWSRVFGLDETGIRSLSALLGTATIPLVWSAAGALGGRRAALIAAALAATNPLLVWYSQETRNYALYVFCAALAFLCFVRALEGRRADGRWLWGWAIASGLALCTHYFAVALIVPQIAWLLWRRPGSRGESLLAGGAVATVGIALLPLLATQRGRGGWIDDYALSDRLAQIPEHFVVGFQVPWQAVAPAAVIAIAAVCSFSVARSERAWLAAVAVPAGTFAAGLLLLLVPAATGDDYLVARNVLGLWIPFAIAIALCLANPAIPRLGAAAAAALSLVGVTLVVWAFATPAAQRPDYSALVEELGPADEERLIVSQSGFNSPLKTYLPHTEFADGTELAAEELVVIELREVTDYGVGPCWWLWTCGGTDLLSPPTFEPPPGFERRGGGSTELFEYAVYEADAPTPVPRPVEFLTPRVFVQSPGEG